MRDKRFKAVRNVLHVRKNKGRFVTSSNKTLFKSLGTVAVNVTKRTDHFNEILLINLKIFKHKLKAVVKHVLNFLDTNMK